MTVRQISGLSGNSRRAIGSAKSVNANRRGETGGAHEESQPFDGHQRLGRTLLVASSQHRVKGGVQAVRDDFHAPRQERAGGEISVRRDANEFRHQQVLRMVSQVHHEELQAEDSRLLQQLPVSPRRAQRP